MLPEGMEDYDWGLTNEKQQEVIAILDAWAAQRRKLAMAQMRVMAAEGGERRFLQGNEGDGGEVKMMIHPMSYHEWGQRVGYECWQDAGFVREYLRDNPEARVRSRNVTPTISMATGLGATARSQAKFHKVYSNS